MSKTPCIQQEFRRCQRCTNIDAMTSKQIMVVLYAIPFGWLCDNRDAVSIHSIFISFFRSFSQHRQASIEKNAEGDKKEDVSK